MSEVGTPPPHNSDKPHRLVANNNNGNKNKLIHITHKVSIYRKLVALSIVVIKIFKFSTMLKLCRQKLHEINLAKCQWFCQKFKWCSDIDTYFIPYVYRILASRKDIGKNIAITT